MKKWFINKMIQLCNYALRLGYKANGTEQELQEIKDFKIYLNNWLKEINTQK